MISLHDILTHAGDRLINDKPFSLYRYTEFMIEAALVKKYGCTRILEVGPGVDPFVAWIEKDPAYTDIMAVDYCANVIEKNKQTFKNSRIHFQTLNLTDPSEAQQMPGNWDAVICNATVEHVPDDHALVEAIFNLLKPGGVFAFSTVLHPFLYNKWDYAMGHYRRYTVQGLKDLCHQFETVQVFQASILQELIRPLFFGRINHLLNNSLEDNNQKVGFLEHARPPYASIYGAVKYLMPIHFFADWMISKIIGGIGIVVAQKPLDSPSILQSEPRHVSTVGAI